LDNFQKKHENNVCGANECYLASFHPTLHHLHQTQTLNLNWGQSVYLEFLAACVAAPLGSSVAATSPHIL